MEELRLDNPKKQYKVVEHIGRGSYGKVYRAIDRTSKKIVAIKVLPLREEDSSKTLANMQREVKMLKTCNSPRVVSFLGAWLQDNTVWIVMEYCRGGSVLDLMRIQQAGLLENEIVAVLAETLKGLKYLHEEMHMIHRDVKAGNILISDDGAVKLADFGVSAQLTCDIDKRDTVIGTPMWMSPEMIEQGQYDMRTDVWSLGITAIELAETLPPLWDVKPAVRVVFLIPSNPPPTLQQPEMWSEDFKGFVGACLTKDPTERPNCEGLLQHPFVGRATSLPPNVLPSLLQRIQRLRQAAKAGQLTTNSGGTIGTASQLHSLQPGGTMYTTDPNDPRENPVGSLTLNSTLPNGTATYGTALASGDTLPTGGTLPSGTSGTITNGTESALSSLSGGLHGMVQTDAPASTAPPPNVGVKGAQSQSSGGRFHTLESPSKAKTDADRAAALQDLQYGDTLPNPMGNRGCNSSTEAVPLAAQPSINVNAEAGEAAQPEETLQATVDLTSAVADWRSYLPQAGLQNMSRTSSMSGEGQVRGADDGDSASSLSSQEMEALTRELDRLPAEATDTQEMGTLNTKDMGTLKTALEAAALDNDGRQAAPPEAAQLLPNRGRGYGTLPSKLKKGFINQQPQHNTLPSGIQDLELVQEQKITVRGKSKISSPRAPPATAATAGSNGGDGIAAGGSDSQSDFVPSGAETLTERGVHLVKKFTGKLKLMKAVQKHGPQSTM